MNASAAILNQIAKDWMGICKDSHLNKRKHLCYNIYI